MTTAEKNEHYGKLNVRFDEREKEIKSLGFKRESLPVYNLAFYVMVRYGKVHAIPACVLSLADEIVWTDKLDEAKRFAN